MDKYKNNYIIISTCLILLGICIFIASITLGFIMGYEYKQIQIEEILNNSVHTNNLIRMNDEIFYITEYDNSIWYENFTIKD